MVLQPLVENAVNHGIATKIKPSTLIIKIKKVNNQLHYAIEDTGVGITDKEDYYPKV